ncbi:MAG: thiosulfate oxidation carrier protein SoxY [Burkholderiales bacterium]|nr:thiosulfate oxidation carrier protein SoxY [Burkholderiales bacterium]
MKVKRRQFLQVAVGASALAALGPHAARQAGAAEWNKVGFQAKAVEQALESLGAAGAVPSKDVIVKAPDIAENGAVVPIEVTSKIPNTRSIAIIADKNPFPLVAIFEFANGAEAYASTRMKMSATSNVRVLARADDKFYTASREVKITIGGCG